MASGEGVNSAMLASMDSHDHSFSGKNIPKAAESSFNDHSTPAVTGEGLGATLGGDTLSVLRYQGLEGILDTGSISVPVGGDLMSNARGVVGQSMGPFGISGTTIPPVDGSLKASASHLGFAEQTNFKLPTVASKGGQEQGH